MKHMGLQVILNIEKPANAMHHHLDRNNKPLKCELFDCLVLSEHHSNGNIVVKCGGTRTVQT